MHINATPHVQSELVHLTEPSTGGCRPASRCHAHHTAKVVAPATLPACDGATLLLDGSLSSGGGPRALSYRWRARPGRTDNYPEVAAALGIEVGSPGAEAAQATERDPEAEAQGGAERHACR